MALNLSQSDCVNLLMEASVTRLQTFVMDTITDDAKAGLVRAGKLQDDPTDRKINILAHPGGEEYKDTLNRHNSPASGKYVESPYWIGEGGGGFYLRYLKLEFQFFFPNSPSRDDAQKKSQLVIDRCKHCLMTWDVGSEVPTDDLGEHAYDLQVLDQWIFEGGGDGDFNWRGWMVIEFLTEQDFSHA